MGGRMIVEVASATITAVGVSNESQQSEFHPYLSQTTMVGMMALLCAFISLVGFVSVIPWHRVWRSREEYVAARLANTGLGKKVLKALPSVLYRKMRSEPNDIVAECPICLAEFMDGERVRILPKCRHNFHAECVDRWFVCHSSCPTCRNCLLKEEAHVFQCGTHRSEACVEIDLPRPAAEEGRAIFSEGGNIASDIECGVRQ